MGTSLVTGAYLIWPFQSRPPTRSSLSLQRRGRLCSQLRASQGPTLVDCSLVENDLILCAQRAHRTKQATLTRRERRRRDWPTPQTTVAIPRNDGANSPLSVPSSQHLTQGGHESRAQAEQTCQACAPLPSAHGTGGACPTLGCSTGRRLPCKEGCLAAARSIHDSVQAGTQQC